MQCDFVQVTAKDGVNLEGLVFNAAPLRRGFAGQTPTTVGVWIHGLTASFHSNYKRHTTLAGVFNDSGIAYATFDTRGHDAIAFAKKYDKRKKKGYRSMTIGGAYEKFSDCVLDQDAIVDYLSKRYQKIILVGHSTGANKVVYYLSRPGRQNKITAAVLVSPVSDVALYKKELGDGYQKALEAARDMIKKGDGDKLMPGELVKYLRTAKRFLSLADQTSVEQMFPTREFRGPLRLFSKIKVPTLIVFGENDDYPKIDKVDVGEIFSVFSRYSRSRSFRTVAIPETDHAFGEKEEELARVLVGWMAGI